MCINPDKKIQNKPVKLIYFKCAIELEFIIIIIISNTKLGPFKKSHVNCWLHHLYA